MKTKIKGLAIAFFITTSVQAFAGDKGGNGGGAYVCTNEKQNITRVYSYDLWSGENDGVMVNREKHYLKFEQLHTDAKTQARNALKRVKAYNSLTYDLMSEILEAMIEKIDNELLKQITALNLRDDYVPVRSPYQNLFCPSSDVEEIVPFRTIINYDDYLNSANQQRRVDSLANSLWDQTRILKFLRILDKDYLSVDQRLYLAMENNTHRAALMLHETLYKVLRTWLLHTNSQDATALTALLLSDISEEVLFAKLDELTLFILPETFLKEKYSRLLKAKSDSELSELLAVTVTLKNLTFTFEDKLKDLACGSVIRPVEDSYKLNEQLKNPTAAKCLSLIAFFSDNKLLFNYLDQRYNPERKILVRKNSNTDKWKTLIESLESEHRKSFNPKVKQKADYWIEKLIEAGF